MFQNTLWFWLLAGYKSLAFLHSIVQARHGTVNEHFGKDVPDHGGWGELDDL